MVFGAISGDGFSVLVKVENKLNSDFYIEMIKTNIF